MASLISDTSFDSAVNDWEELANEYKSLQELHHAYKSKFAEFLSLQKKCASCVHHQRYRLKAIEKMLRHAESTPEKADLERDMEGRKAQLKQIEDSLPRASGTYLNIILGSINVSILDKKAKYDYKDQYESFKLIVNLVGCVLACLCLYFNNRVLDLLFLFLTVWYYCTLTIRESILKVNGSRIKGWWRTHHFLSTFAGGVLLIWPDGGCYQDFRSQMMWFNVYVAFVQYLQFTYQRGVLYRLRSLGERTYDMDITIDGFHSWMWKGLGFLLPFLYAGYVFQLYNAYSLYHLSFRPDAPWQVSCLGLTLCILGLGNVVTTSATIPSKIGKEKQKWEMELRFTRLDKYFWGRKQPGKEEEKEDDKSKED